MDEPRPVKTPGGPPGPPSHYEALDFIHIHLMPRTYVEIGVNRGRSLALALPGTRAVGIDPKPWLRHPISRSTKVFPLASDTFFELVDLEEALGGKVDVAFIDGMHLFEFALRDFANLERACTENSVVLLHDCLPSDAAVAARERRKGWTGDVWKLIVCLRKYRPDLEITVVDVPESGLGIVRGLDPRSTVLHDRRTEVLRELLPLDVHSLAGGMEAALNPVPGDWGTLRSVLPSRPYRRRSRPLLRAGRFMRHAVAKKLRRRVRGRDAADARLRARVEELEDTAARGKLPDGSNP
jgi:methyltransferase family protein